MALFLPPTFQNVKNKGEAEVFAWLSALPDDYIIYQNIQLHSPSGTHSTKHEIDFTLIHRYAGVIVLEVKGGRRIDANGIAEQYTPTGTKRTDPYAQVMAARAALWDRLTLEPTLKDCFDREGVALDRGMAYGVCFPAKKRKAFAFATPERGAHTLTMEEARQIGAFIDRLAPPHATPIFTPAEWEVLTEAIWRLTGRHHTLAQRFAEERVIFDQLIAGATAQIDTHMQSHAATPRLAVEGRAGTGKTVLAFRTAQRLAAQGQRVLFLCASVSEKDMLTGDLHFDFSPYTPKPLFAVLPVEEWFQSVLTRAGIALPTALDLLTVPGQRAAAPLLLDALARLAAAGQPTRYDAIMVDEAQDFTAPLWPVILGCVASEGGRCYAFYDNEQSLSSTPFAPAWLGDAVVSLRLDANLRNTRAIYQQMRRLNHTLVPLPASALNPDGIPVIVESPALGNAHSAAAKERIARLTDDATRRTKVEEAQLTHYLDMLINHEKVLPQNILIISCRRQRAGTGKNKAQASAFFRRTKIGDFAICPLRERSQDDLPRDKESVRITTLHAVKGLDSDVVILVELDGMTGNPLKKRLGYIAVSRARHALYVFGKPKELRRYFTVVATTPQP